MHKLVTINMKKTLITLAVVTSSLISGSVMAWETNGTGGSVSIGGSLTPAENITPWEVKTGEAVTGLDADINKGQSVVNIAVDKAISILGIRTVVGSTETFHGEPGISPAIDFHGKIDLDGFSDSITTLKLDVNDLGGSKIGSLTVPLVAGGEVSYRNDDGSELAKKFVVARQMGDAFWGGAPKDGGLLGDTWTKLYGIDNSILANYNDQSAPKVDPGTETFTHANYTYSGYYGAGIERGKVIKITLDSPAQGDAPIAWKASLPITVSYQ